jgi:hypothetical protein
VAKELEHYAPRTVRDNAIAEDSRLVRTEVDRCREIPGRMSTAGAEPSGEALENVPVEALAGAVRGAPSAGGDLRVHVAEDAATTALKLPKHAAEQALIALVSF